MIVLLFMPWFQGWFAWAAEQMNLATLNAGMSATLRLEIKSPAVAACYCTTEEGTAKVALLERGVQKNTVMASFHGATQPARASAR
jgi:hypothetical protein